jgi:hypothetical protein
VFSRWGYVIILWLATYDLILKYALTETGIHYYFKGAGYRHAYWKHVTRVRFILGSRVVRVYTKDRNDIGKILRGRKI